MPRREFRYPINEREIYVSENAIRAGEKAFGRPADLNERETKLPFREGQRILIEAEYVKEIDYANDDGPGYVSGAMLTVAGKTVCVRADALQTEQPKDATATQAEIKAAIDAFKESAQGHPHLQCDYQSMRAALNVVLTNRAEQAFRVTRDQVRRMVERFYTDGDGRPILRNGPDASDIRDFTEALNAAGIEVADA
jgi:hypothetical protein